MKAPEEDYDFTELIKEEKLQELREDLEKYISDRIIHKDLLYGIMQEIENYEEEKAKIIS